MEKNEIINLVVIMGLMALIGGIGIVWIVSDKVMNARIAIKKDIRRHQEWLFDQLYSMAPEKVLSPDEEKPEEVSRPAVVVHTSRDPMNEFNGKKDDWFSA